MAAIAEMLAYAENLPPAAFLHIDVFKNEKLYADGYDIDEDNDEIARMFWGKTVRKLQNEL